jgi:hypothetical protein
MPISICRSQINRRFPLIKRAPIQPAFFLFVPFLTSSLRLLGVIQLGGAARLFPEDIVDVFECLFEHLGPMNQGYGDFCTLPDSAPFLSMRAIGAEEASAILDVDPEAKMAEIFEGEIESLSAVRRVPRGLMRLGEGGARWKNKRIPRVI